MTAQGQHGEGGKGRRVIEIRLKESGMDIKTAYGHYGRVEGERRQRCWRAYWSRDLFAAMMAAGTFDVV